jgi:hypothetical protein
MLVGVHALGFIPRVGPMLLFLGMIVLLGLTIDRLVTRAARRGDPDSPLRGLVLVFAAITLASLVLAILSGFQPNDWIVVVVPAAATAVVWTADRAVARYWTHR